MSRIVLTVAAIALMAWFAIPGSAIAAEPSRAGMRDAGSVEAGSARRHHKRSAQQTASSHPHDKPWVGNTTDFAGNSYVYYRVGPGTPFGPGGSLRRAY